jgi:hypothetical protein
MKNYLSLFILLLVISCATEDTYYEKNIEEQQKESASRSDSDAGIHIGNIIEDEIIPIFNFQELSSILSNKIQSTIKSPVSFSEIEIQFLDDEYLLYAIDSKNSHKTIFTLVNEGERILYFSDGGKDITCSGYKTTGPNSAKECQPKKGVNGHYYCTDCSRGDCTKTVTVHTNG